MKEITIGQICEVTRGKLQSGKRETAIKNICIDSRASDKNMVFFALIGEKNDAHKFLGQVIEKGCRSLVVSDEKAISELLNNQRIIEQVDDKESLNIVIVQDTTKAMQELAKWYVKNLNITKIGVTGSTGKTTTKDMLYYVCSEKYKTGRTENNFNNHIGLPLTLFSFDEDIEVGILEMGMDKLGEIDLLSSIARPDMAVITNIGVSHIENLGSQEGILKAKMEITNYFDSNNLLIISDDGELLTEQRVSGDYRLVTTGEAGKNNFIISNVCDFGENGVQFNIEHNYEIQEFKLPIPGRHNVYNASLAVACGVELGISLKEAAIGLQKIVITDKRLSIKGKDGIKVIDDTYNASPASMKGALDVLLSTKGIRKVAVLGDMFELGKDSEYYHEEVGAYVAMKNIGLLITIGKDAKFIAKGASTGLSKDRIKYYKTKEEFIKEIDSVIMKGDVVLVKGSRAMEMEKIVKKIVG